MIDGKMKMEICKYYYFFSIIQSCFLNKVVVFLFVFIGITNISIAQTGIIEGVVLDNQNKPIIGATVTLENTDFGTSTDVNGKYILKNIPYGEYAIISYAYGKTLENRPITIDQPKSNISFVLNDLITDLDPVEIHHTREKTFGITKLKAVDGFGIYEGKKTEVVDLKNITGNTSTNNPRQVYGKITGLNIWESDGAGLQLGIGGRGLSPNRTANFNVRQNGYDISADALGYPESYYTPPIEALDRIEIVRGAASLQYGTQFGGMVNFRFKEGPKDKKIEFTTRQTGGSWLFYNSFNSIGGTILNGKFNYYAYVQYKRGDGYRENSGFNYFNAYGSIKYDVNKKLQLKLDYTKMNYLAQQPGGLTDKNFENDIQQSFRARNWFKVDWNLMAFSSTYQINKRSKINSRTFGLIAQRQSLGNLERINVADLGQNRTLISGDFNNIGNETRYIHNYNLFKQKQVFLTGFRLYHGITTTMQGEANDKSGPDFNYLNPNNLENSEYAFPNKNYSLFAEHIFQFNSKLSLTPGIRHEYIETNTEGYYKQRVFDGAGNIIVENRIDEESNRNRQFTIFGLGASYKLNSIIEFYGNFSQNYKAINFSDLRVVNPNFVVDENIQDETGYSADLGIRGQYKLLFSYEITGFLLKYNGKIGQVLRSDQAPLYNDYRFRGNISDARNYGVEAFVELNILKALKKKTNPKFKWTVYTNFAYVNAKYINTEDESIKNKNVEMVPPIILRTGTAAKYKSFKASIQYNYIQEHFSDATNAIRTATAVEGIIPSYDVMDLSVSYEWTKITLEGSINNLLNEKYFTRRAEAYPGPGILPSDARSFFLTFQYKI